MARELTKKQKAFVAEYLNNLNATKAAIAAGYSAHTASQQGSRLLKNSKVAEAINEEFIPRHERLETAADRMLQELRPWLSTIRPTCLSLTVPLSGSRTWIRLRVRRL